jgi:hypothetical protein
MLPQQMNRAQADSHRAQLLQTATTVSGPEGQAAWGQLRDFNAARRVAAQHGQLCEQQRRNLAKLAA